MFYKGKIDNHGNTGLDWDTRGLKTNYEGVTMLWEQDGVNFIEYGGNLFIE